MERWTSEVLEDEDHIELLQTKLNTFQRSDLNICQRDNEEWRIRKMNETICRRL